MTAFYYMQLLNYYKNNEIGITEIRNNLNYLNKMSNKIITAKAV